MYGLVDFVPEHYIICMINSSFMSYYVDDFVNNTQTFQINDARQLPIIIPTEKQLEAFKIIFDRAYKIKKEQFSGIVSEEKAEMLLEPIQQELDKLVEELYGV